MASFLRAAVLFSLLATWPATALAQQVTGEAGREAVQTFTDAVSTGDPAVIEALLAPEFQIVRSNGVTISKEDYVGGFPGSHSIAGKIVASDVHATGGGDIMVVSYRLELSEKIDGADIASNAPRLTVFRRIDGEWKVSAHANFGAVAPPN